MAGDFHETVKTNVVALYQVWWAGQGNTVSAEDSKIWIELVATCKDVLPSGIGGWANMDSCISEFARVMATGRSAAQLMDIECAKRDSFLLSSEE
eukprot:9495812-Pyramimonas_sp.AAC.1